VNVTHTVGAAHPHQSSSSSSSVGNNEPNSVDNELPTSEMPKNHDENASPILIRGPNGIPVGVVSPKSVARNVVGENGRQTNVGYPRSEAFADRQRGRSQQQQRVPSSVLRATAVRKTATTKKKKTEARDGKGRKHVVDVGDGDDVWRPLGAGVNEDGMGLLQPPRMSEEVQPVNLQGLFEGEEVNEFSKVAVFVRIRPDGGRGREEPGALGSAGSVGHSHYPHQRACLYAESGSRLGVSAPLGSLAYKNGECQVGQLMAFNRVFGPETSQTEYYVQTSKALVEQLVQRERYEGVFLSYGITASGKTYTIQGTKESPGIIPLALWTLFGKLMAKGEGGGGTVQISYCEIYNEAIYDLLTDSPGSHAHVHGKRPALKLMEAKDGSMMVDKLSWVTVGHAQEAWNVLRGGMKQRKRAATKLNYSSSRSHSVCSIRLTDMVSGNMSSRKLSFVDLAGSERAHRTGTAGAGAGSSSHGSLGAHSGMAARMKEAVSINGSLMTLGRCLEALRLNQKNKTTTQVIPYRESKVTHMFRDALHGYGNVVLSVNVSSAPADFDETLRVLKYAATASQIATTAAKPVKPSQMTMGERGAEHLQQVDVRLLPRPEINTTTTATATTSPTKQGRIRKETPLGLRRHRQLMEMGRRDERAAADVSVSIDSRIQGASPSPLIPQLLCEEEIDNKGGALAVDEGAMEMIREEETSSSGSSSSDEEDQEEDEGDEGDGGVTMRGGKPARGFAAHEDKGVDKADEADEADIAEGDAAKHHEDHKDAVIARLRHDLRVAEEKLQEVEAEVRDEVATEMTQIIDTVEETYKQQIDDDAKAAEARVRTLEAKHEEELASMEATIESQQRGLDELRATVGDLERRASKRRKKAAAAEEDAQRYKNALNDALAEIEKLHGIIEQEEEANAKLAAALSDILREQSLPDSPNSPGRDVREAAKIKRIKREVKREVTQLEANNAMEQDMSEQMIDRLKKDNEVLRSKLVAMTHAIESCCTPSRNAVFQNLVTACPGGHGRGASGTPHDVALARARRLLDNGSPAADESPNDSMTKSRFAKEAQGGSESPKAIGNGTSADIGGLLAVGGGEEIQPLETIKTQGTPSTLNSKEERTKGASKKATTAAKEATPLRRSPRRSPRKHLSSAGDDANEDEGRTAMEAEAVVEKEEAVEPELPKTATRVTRRNRNAKKKASKNDVDIDATPAAAKPTVPKSRKLLSTASKQTPMRMLGISNTSAAKRSRRLGALPTAEELGFKT